MDKEKIVLLALIFIAITIGIITTLYKPNTLNSSNPEEAGNTAASEEEWKRYENDEWGFSFSYPADWVLKEHTLTQQGAIGSTRSVGEFNGVSIAGDGYMFQFDMGGLDRSPELTYTNQEYVIDGTKVIGTKYETDSKFGISLYVPLKNSHTKVQNLGIRFGNTDPNVKYAPVIEQILSSIKLK